MICKEKILSETNIEVLRAALIDAIALNQKLHRRAQRLEGMEVKLRRVRRGMQNSFDAYVKSTSLRIHNLRIKLRKTKSKLDELPFIIKVLWL